MAKHRVCRASQRRREGLHRVCRASKHRREGFHRVWKASFHRREPFHRVWKASFHRREGFHRVWKASRHRREPFHRGYFTFFHVMPCWAVVPSVFWRRAVHCICPSASEAISHHSRSSSSPRFFQRVANSVPSTK